MSYLPIGNWVHINRKNTYKLCHIIKPDFNYRCFGRVSVVWIRNGKGRLLERTHSYILKNGMIKSR
jgi:hypothetical protein